MKADGLGPVEVRRSGKPRRRDAGRSEEAATGAGTVEPPTSLRENTWKMVITNNRDARGGGGNAGAAAAENCGTCDGQADRINFNLLLAR